MMNARLVTRREILFGAAAAVLGDLFLNAQGTPEGQKPKFSVDVEVVNVFVTVRDKKGHIVKDLVKEDFSLSEDGRPQNIRYFAHESDLPLTIGLLVDTTPSESNMLDVERKASLAFLNRMLRPEQDKAFLIQYYQEIELLQDLTSSREKLEHALSRLRSHGMGTQRNARGAGSQRGLGAFETALADAVYLASDEIMKLQQGRKALFILGDGDHIGDRGDEAIEAAQHADTMIYSIRIYDRDRNFDRGGPSFQIPGIGVPGRSPGSGRGLGWPLYQRPGGGPGGGMNQENGKKNLQELSKKTGGAYFEVGKKDTLDQIYANIEEELRSQYSLGYAPDANALSGFRKINISVKQKDLVVRGREGYYPRSK
jgi:VWFA-related protein